MVKGQFKWPDGSSYNGQFEKGELTGEGILKMKNEVIKGTWVGGKLHGKGSRQLLKEDEIYEGEWVEGKLTGKGKF